MTSPEFASSSSQALNSAEDFQTDQLPEGYRHMPDGLYTAIEGKDGEHDIGLKICSPIRVSANFSDPGEIGWGILVEVTDPKSCLHSVQIDYALLDTKPTQVRSLLASAGLRLASGSKAPVALIDFLKQSRPTQHNIKVSRLGWVDATFKAFVPEAGRVLGNGEFIRASDLKAANDSVPQCSTIESWRAHVSGYLLGTTFFSLRSHLPSPRPC